MPLYEYECEGGHKFEEWHRIDDRHNVLCPLCEEPARLMMSSFAFRFAQPFTVIGHDGNVLHRTQTIQRTAPPGYRYDNTNLVEA